MLLGGRAMIGNSSGCRRNWPRRPATTARLSPVPSEPWAKRTCARR